MHCRRHKLFSELTPTQLPIANVASELIRKIFSGDKIMKNLILAVFLAALSVAAGEREDLLKVFAKENKAANENFQKAETTVELTAGAGQAGFIAEKQLFRALDYKLRNTPNQAERLRLLEDFHELSKKLQVLKDTPREDMGSSAGMHIYFAMANETQRMIAILLLDADTEKRWAKIANAPMVLDKLEITLQHGQADFSEDLYGAQRSMQVRLWPRNTFTYQNRIFVLFFKDMEFSGNDDFATSYLCELKKGKLQVHTKLEMPYFNKWTLNKNKLTVIGSSKEKEEISL